MKLSTQEEYGLRCLLQIARHGGSLTIPELSRLEGISVPNTAKLLRLLRRGGFVRSTRGQSGGYSLARAAERISVGDVLDVLGGRFFDPKFCDRHAGLARSCAHLGECSIRPVLRRLQDAVDQVLDELTLKSLLGSEHDLRTWTSPRAVNLPMLPH